MNMDSRRRYMEDYLHEIEKTLDIMESTMLDKLSEVTDVLIDARNKGKMILIMGNGGSASTASHFASDLNKTAIVEGERRFKAIALTDNLPLITAWSNDKSYDDVFAEQLENYIREDDVVIGISGSGRSKNIIKAIEKSNAHGGLTLGFTGFEGGVLKDVAKVSIIVPSKNMQIIEDVHMLLVHLLSSVIRDEGIKSKK